MFRRRLLTNGMQVFPTEISQAVLSTPFIFILLAGLLTVPLLVVLLLGGFRAGQKSDAEPLGLRVWLLAPDGRFSQ